MYKYKLSEKKKKKNEIDLRRVSNFEVTFTYRTPLSKTLFPIYILASGGQVNYVAR